MFDEETVPESEQPIEEQPEQAEVESVPEVEEAVSEKERPKDEETDWKTEARKHERRAKQERRRREELEAAQKERTDADKSEQEKAVEAAREEGRTAALEEGRQERRNLQLKMAVGDLAAKGVRLGDEEDDAKFAKKGVLLLLQQAVDRGDVDAGDLFDDQDQVQPRVLRDSVADILGEESWLVVREEPADPKPRGSSDAGRGSSAAKSVEEMSPEDHLKELQGRT